ncbi:MAG: glycosyltransferase [Flavobacteriaceae bacterium]|nr:glycosyltransferase [Flavobacteriaceae bacterium]
MKGKKIALVGFRLNEGGADRVMANLSNFFHDQGFEVHVIIFHDSIGYPYSGKVFNLGKLKSQKNDFLNKVKRFHHLKKYIKHHGFDHIIDFRFRINFLQELMISKWIYKNKAVYTVHSSKLDVYMPNNSFLTRLIYSNSRAMISITRAMQQLIIDKHGLNNIINIYNPIDVSKIDIMAKEKVDLDFEYIIAAGEFDKDTKQFDKLIRMYSRSKLPEKEVALVIIGRGEKENYLKSIINELKLNDHVHLIGFQGNPYKYFAKAKFLVLTSLFEGLPMVLLESLAAGTPVIAWDCPTGPSEIIEHENNGLLIENQNEDKFIEAMNTFLINDQLYQNCKRHTVDSIKKFDLEQIGREWLQLLNNDQ